MSLQEQLERYLKNNWEWQAKGKLTADMVWKHTKGQKYGKRFLPETVGRALRLLEESKMIAVKPHGISVQYKWLPLDRRAKYIPSSERPEREREILFKQ